MGLLAYALRDRKNIESHGVGNRTPGTAAYQLGKRVLLGLAGKKDTNDDEVLVRLAAVRGLGTVGDAADLGLVQSLADHGEGHDDEATAALRKAAAEAVKALQTK